MKTATTLLVVWLAVLVTHGVVSKRAVHGLVAPDIKPASVANVVEYAQENDYDGIVLEHDEVPVFARGESESIAWHKVNQSVLWVKAENEESVS